MTKPPDRESPISIKTLFPDLDDEQARDVDARTRRYLELAWSIYLKVRADPERRARLAEDLTRSRNGATIRTKVDNKPSSIDGDEN